MLLNIVLGTLEKMSCIFIASFTLKKSRGLAVWLPAAAALLTALLMYAGELILLNGELYRFGRGFFFDGLPLISLALVDILVILASGALTALIAALVRRRFLCTGVNDRLHSGQ